MTEPRVYLSEMSEEDIPFLQELWRTRSVMRYADEFPRIRRWSRSTDPQKAWRTYQERRAELGNDYTQLVLRLLDGTPIGESFLGPFWTRKLKVKCLIADIKLMPRYWGRGLGTEGMRQVVPFVFGRTDCELFVVPPHRENQAAIRVYEKAGFVLMEKTWMGHSIMKMDRERYTELYEP